MWWCAESDCGKRDAWNQLQRMCHKYDANMVENISLFLEPSEIVQPLAQLQGQTAMHVAAQFGAVHSMDWLKSLGSDINLQDDMGMSPLHVAADKTKHEAMRCLSQPCPRTCACSVYAALANC